MAKVVSFGSFDINDGVEYEAAFDYSYGLPSVNPAFIERTNATTLIGNASYTARQLQPLTIFIGSGDRTALQTVFDPTARLAQPLVIADDDGSNARYVMAMCTAFDQLPRTVGYGYVATLHIHGDVYWRATTATTSSDSITSSGDQVIYLNNGDLDAYPIYSITPTATRSGGNTRRRFVPVLWPYDRGSTREAIDIVSGLLDTRIASTQFASATGADIRIFVDSSPADFWISAPNTANTKLWCNLDFAAGVSLTLNGGVNSSATSLAFNEAIDALPPSGILYFTGNAEAVIYTAKNTTTKTVSGVVRGAKGTVADTQSNAAAVAWLQHDIWIAYGDATATAYVPDDTKKPAFDLASSTNTSWVYSSVFGDDARLRSGAWRPGAGIGGNTADTGYCFTRDHSAGGAENVTPWNAIGAAQTAEGETRWVLYSPRGISAANFTAGKKHTATAASAASFASVQSATNGNDWTLETAIAANSANGWETWTANVTSLYTANSKETKYVALRVFEGADDAENYKVLATACAVTLQNGITTALAPQMIAYSSDITLTNDGTGHAIRIQLPVPLSAAIIVDTDQRTVTLADGTNVLDALTLVGGVRADWLKFVPGGGNIITVTESGLAGLDLNVEYKMRFFD